MVADEGKCVWYGICKYEKVKNSESVKIKNCINNTEPLPLTSKGIKDLKIWCSHLLPKNYKNGDDVFTCCDENQIFQLVKNYETAVSIFGRCPSCAHNLVRHMCDFICSPRHAEYIKVKDIKKNELNRKLFRIKIFKNILTVNFEQRNTRTRLISMFPRII